MRCPGCDQPIAYIRTLTAGDPERPIRCDACGCALRRRTARWTYIYAALSLSLSVAFQSVALFVIMLAADLVVDQLTCELVPLEIESRP